MVLRQYVLFALIVQYFERNKKGIKSSSDAQENLVLKKRFFLKRTPPHPHTTGTFGLTFVLPLATLAIAGVFLDLGQVCVAPFFSTRSPTVCA